MRIIFCDSVFDNQLIDPDYHIELTSASNAGFKHSLISYEELIDGNIDVALKYISPQDNVELAIYRGWMLTPSQYVKLYEGLLDRNIKLINTPEAYKHCHYLPESFSKIESKSPKSNWSTLTDENTIIELSNAFGSSSIIIKDFVKSEKHNWEDACFIQDASDKVNVKTITNNFLSLRGESLNEGIVFRQFVELEFLTEHSKSGMPLTKEFRVFFMNKQVVCVLDYWDEGEYNNTKPNLSEFIDIAQNVESEFFTMDIALAKDGNWIIMELGDGQVSGLPDNANTDIFYQIQMEIITK